MKNTPLQAPYSVQHGTRQSIVLGQPVSTSQFAARLSAMASRGLAFEALDGFKAKPDLVGGKGVLGAFFSLNGRAIMLLAKPAEADVFNVTVWVDELQCAANGESSRMVAERALEAIGLDDLARH